MMMHTFSMKPLACFLPSFLILASRVVCLSLLALAGPVIVRFGTDNNKIDK